MSSVTIPAGTTWAYGWPILNEDSEPVDLNGWSARGQVRPNKWVKDDNPPLHEWVSSGVSPNISLLNASVVIQVESDESADWTWWVGAFQLKLIDPDGRVARIDEFDMRVSPDVVY